MGCPACQTAAPATTELVRCATCETVFDPLAQAHKPPRAVKPAIAPRGMRVEKSGQELTATLKWIEVWNLRVWPAITVTLMHFVLIGFGATYGAWGSVALLAFAVGVQFVVYSRVLAQRTRLVAGPDALRIERMRGAELLPKAQLLDLFVIEVGPRSLGGKPLAASRKTARMYGLCALAPGPRRIVDGLPTLEHAPVLEDALRVTLGVPRTEVKGAIRRS